jgi:hypothetical protein
MFWRRSDGRTMYDFFVTYWVPFGELLTDMEKMGFYVETPHLKAMEVLSRYFQLCFCLVFHLSS